MSTKKSAPDQDIEPEYDFWASKPNPHAERAALTPPDPSEPPEKTPRQVFSVPTASGAVLSDADLDALAAKAEAGFDPSRWTPRRG